jgi:cellulose biosynthesis protein BcsQ
MHVVAVPSSKGGVGKTTLVTQLMYLLSKNGIVNAAIDTDIQNSLGVRLSKFSHEKVTTWQQKYTNIDELVQSLDGEELFMPVPRDDYANSFIGFIPTEAINRGVVTLTKQLEKVGPEVLFLDFRPPVLQDIMSTLELVQDVAKDYTIIIPIRPHQKETYQAVARLNIIRNELVSRGISKEKINLVLAINQEAPYCYCADELTEMLTQTWHKIMDLVPSEGSFSGEMVADFLSCLRAGDEIKKDRLFYDHYTLDQKKIAAYQLDWYVREPFIHALEPIKWRSYTIRELYTELQRDIITGIDQHERILAGERDEYLMELIQWEDLVESDKYIKSASEYVDTLRQALKLFPDLDELDSRNSVDKILYMFDYFREKVEKYNPKKDTTGWNYDSFLYATPEFIEEVSKQKLGEGCQIYRFPVVEIIDELYAIESKDILQPVQEFLQNIPSTVIAKEIDQLVKQYDQILATNWYEESSSHIFNTQANKLLNVIRGEKCT